MNDETQEPLDQPQGDTQGPEPGPKIHVDEDWKQRVQAEKEELDKKAKQQQAEKKQRPPLPPASFATLVTNFATQAAVALGQVVNPVTKKQEVDLEMARYSIDLLETVQEKTKGNLDDDEQKLLEAVLYDLRIAYVTVSSRPQETKTQDSPIITPGANVN